MKRNFTQFGCLPDPVDERDVLLSSVQSPIDIPDEYKTAIKRYGIDSQNGQPSCVGNASSKVKEHQEYLDLKKVLDFSPRFIYALCKKIDDWSGKGTYLRIAMKVLQKWGVCLEDLFKSDYSLPYDKFKDWKEIPDEAIKQAERYKIKTYARVDNNWEALKQAIYQNGVVLSGATGSREGWSQLPIRPPKDDENTWGHAIALTGYDKDYIYFVNSWSSSWGSNGIGYFGKDYLPLLHSTWTSVDIDTNLLMTKEQITKLYQAVFHREPDEGAWSFINKPLDVVLDGFLNSEEWKKYDPLMKDAKAIEEWARQ